MENLPEAYRSIAFFGTANSEESQLAQLARVENLPEAYRSIAFFQNRKFRGVPTS